MEFYLVKSDELKFRYFFTDKLKALMLFDILQERYNRVGIEFKTLDMSDAKEIAAILDEILIKDME